MNNLTLIGYLKKQIKNNGCGSLSISKLSSYSLEHNELLHHIALYAYLTDKIHLCGKNEALYMECMKIKNNEFTMHIKKRPGNSKKKMNSRRR